jgi:vancomycin resistance protein YoaR
MKIFVHYSSLVLASKIFVLGIFGIVIFYPQTARGITFSSIIIQAGDYKETISTNNLPPFIRLDTRKTYIPSLRSEIENTFFCPTKKLFCAFSLSNFLHQHIHNTATKTIDKTQLETFIKELAEKSAQDSVDAKFSVLDGRVIVAEQEKLGQRLKEKESLSLLERALKNAAAETIKVSLPVEITEPKLSASDIERLGLKELVGEGRTNFKGSPKNRIYNIKRSLEQFQNIIIAPGEEFSFVKYLGEVDGEHGYLPELVIKNNRTEPEFGGGICQVSTTMFRAAIYSGMKVIQRRNHAYPVKYYRPYGMDATVYIPKPDLTFVNNTPGSILVQSNIENDTELIFRFYGTKDGRVITVDGPHILQSNPDGSMKTVFSQLVTDADGTSIINDSFWSNYKSPSLFPHPGEEPIYTTKPDGWSAKQWNEYKKIHPR